MSKTSDVDAAFESELWSDSSRPAEPNGHPTNGIAASILVDPTDPIARVSELAIRRRSGLISLAMDTMALVAAATASAGLVSLAHTHSVSSQSFAFTTTLARLFATLPLLVILVSATRVRGRLRTTAGQQFLSITIGLGIATTIALVGWKIASSNGIVTAPSDGAILAMAGFGIVAVAVARATHESPTPRLGRHPQRILVLGSGDIANRITQLLLARGGVEIVGHVDSGSKVDNGCIGRLNELASVCERERVDHVVVAYSQAGEDHLVRALRAIQGRVPITVVPRLLDVIPPTATLSDVGFGFTGITVTPATLGKGPRLVKRAIDVVGAGVILIVLFPLLLVVAVAIRLTSPGPVLFRQTRGGRDGQHFGMLKLRSMYVDAALRHPAAAGTTYEGLAPKEKDDPRITPVGRVIRRLCIDEMPQLWNVLRGEMSLVGPRPLPIYEGKQLSGWAQMRNGVRPGLSGLWQISGRSDLSFDEMCRLDSLYVSHWSLALDVRIMVGTLGAIAFGSGAR